MTSSDNQIAERIDDIRSTLRQCAEDLNDLAMAVLSAAIDHGVSSRPEEEKRISKARRTIERAIAQLSGADTAATD